VEAALVVTERVALTDDPSADIQPALSPDGTKVAFASRRDGNLDLWVMNLDGTEVRQLTHSEGANVYCDDPQWSPKGDFLVYTSNKGETQSLDVWVIGADGTNDHPLTVEPSTDWMPAWSPDGRQIAFVSDRGGRDSLWLMDVDGQNARQVLENVWDPCWSPEGQQLAFYSIRQNQDGLWVMRLGEAEPRLILSGGESPTWSPDGRYLACARPGENNTKQIWVVDLHRGTSFPLGPPAGRQESPSWRGDGTVLLYDSDEGGNKDLWLVRLREARPVVEITHPRPNETLKGTVVVQGRVGGEGVRVQSYRLECGPGTNPTRWTLLAEGRGPLEGDLAHWETSALEGPFTLRLTAVDENGETVTATVPVGVFGQYGVLYEEHTIPAQMLAGEVYEVELNLQNGGSMTWRCDGPFRVTGSYQWLNEQGQVVVDTGLETPLPHDVNSGATVHLLARVAAPLEAGRYTLRWDLRQGDQLWFSEQGGAALEVPVTVEASYAVEYRVYNVPRIMVPGQIYSIDVTLRNLGASSWPGLPAAGAPAAREESPPETAGAPAAAEPEPAAGAEAPPAAAPLAPAGALALSYRWVDAQGAVVETTPLRTYLPRDVRPGDSVDLRARVQAPAISGDYGLQWDLVRNGNEWFSEQYHTVCLTSPVTVRLLYAAEFVACEAPARMFPGEIYTATVQVRNTGSVAWRAEGERGVFLSYRWVGPQGQAVIEPGLVTPLTYEVAPGSTAELVAKVQAPGQPGEYTLEWDLGRPGGFRFSEHGSAVKQVKIKVGSPTHNVEFVSHDHLAEMIVGQPYTVQLKLINTGAMTWANEGEERIQLGYHWVDEKGQEVPAERILTPLGQAVDQGQSVSLLARVRAPERAGRYTLKWDLIRGEKAWFSALGVSTLNIPVRVLEIYGVTYLTHDTPPEMVAGQRYTVNVRVRNDGTIPWESEGPIPVALSYRWLDRAGETVEVAQLKTRVPQTVAMGETVDFRAFVQAPDAAGEYVLAWDLLHGEALWFSEKGAAPLVVSVVVK